MGKYDSIHDGATAWQTKGLVCRMMRFKVGDSIPMNDPSDFQVQILGGTRLEEDRYSFATIRNGVLAEVDVPRDRSLFLIGYHGGVGQAMFDEPKTATPLRVWSEPTTRANVGFGPRGGKTVYGDIQS
jgi:hypothetical protein